MTANGSYGLAAKATMTPLSNKRFGTMIDAALAEDENFAGEGADFY